MRVYIGLRTYFEFLAQAPMAVFPRGPQNPRPGLAQDRPGLNFKSLHRQKPGAQARIHAGWPGRAVQEHCPMPITDKYVIVLQYLSAYHHLCDKGQWSCYHFAGNGPLKRLLVRGRWVASECWVSQNIFYTVLNISCSGEYHYMVMIM